MCKVLNRKIDNCSDAVYIGRGSKWGNPYVIGVHGNRAEVIAKYEVYLSNNEMLLKSLDQLKGKNLACYCSPLACHGDLLLKLANTQREERIKWWKSTR